MNRVIASFLAAAVLAVGFAAAPAQAGEGEVDMPRFRELMQQIRAHRESKTDNTQDSQSNVISIQSDGINVQMSTSTSTE